MANYKSIIITNNRRRPVLSQQKSIWFIFVYYCLKKSAVFIDQCSFPVLKKAPLDNRFNEIEVKPNCFDVEWKSSRLKIWKLENS